MHEEYNNVWCVVQHWVSKILNGFLDAIYSSQKHLAATFHTTPKSPIAQQPHKVFGRNHQLAGLNLILTVHLNATLDFLVVEASFETIG